ncbi:fatty-acid-binding protein 1-like [Tripterygium wilfordii]|uniref:fatty-acid-binding protein 1-like n=1 Tax=Tripterygium wilfordii TaxID=458696 RepID=UPI0018F861F3|nr:fatty-acid-binding protein 1-like [Tripterygium wilfordii]
MAINNTENVTAKAADVVEDKVNGTESKVNADGEMTKDTVNGTENGTKGTGKQTSEEEVQGDKKAENEVKKEEEVAVETEQKTGVSFPVKLGDGKKLLSVGLRKKSMLGMGVKVYAFGMYGDNEKMKEVLKSKIGKAPAKPTKEMYEVAIDSDVEMTVKLVIVFSNLTMSMVRKNFDEGLGASIKKLTGGKKNDELANKVMGSASDNIKLTTGSVIEISRLPGYILQTKVMDEEVSKVESELLCRAFIYMYLGEDPFDKEAKEKFGMSLLSLF